MYFLELIILCLEIEGGKSQPECFPMVPKAKAKNKKKNMPLATAVALPIIAKNGWPKEPRGLPR